jgi:hypothetical protein
MKLNEIITADEKLKLAQLIFKNTFDQLVPVVTVPQPQNTAKPAPVKTKAKVAKRVPTPPKNKPLPKAKRLPLTPTQIKQQHHKNQQDYANAVKKTLDKNITKSSVPLRPNGNLKAPIAAGDPVPNKSLSQIGLQADLQKRDNGSKPQFF